MRKIECDFNMMKEQFLEAISIISGARSINQLRLFAFTAALVYASTLASLPLLAFMDRENYLAYATNANAILAGFSESGVLAIFVNEPLWLLTNIALGMMLPPDGVMRCIIFVSAFAFTYTFLRADPKNLFWLVLLLFLPQILKNFITHLRQGLAISVFMMGYLATRPRLRYLGILAAPFIHASFFFVVFLMIFEKIGRSLTLGAGIRSLGALSVAVMLGGTMLYISAWTGARQGEEYAAGAAVTTGMGFVFWGGILALMTLEGSHFLKRDGLALLAVIFYLGTYFLSPVAARIYESALPVVLLALLTLTGWRLHAALSALLGYGGLQWALGLLQERAMF
jgi:hypothetical protein